MKATIYGNINTLDEINSKLDIAERKKIVILNTQQQKLSQIYKKEKAANITRDARKKVNKQSIREL